MHLYQRRVDFVLVLGRKKPFEARCLATLFSVGGACLRPIGAGQRLIRSLSLAVLFAVESCSISDFSRITGSWFGASSVQR
jgi:hypothetical protein